MLSVYRRIDKRKLFGLWLVVAYFFVTLCGYLLFGGQKLTDSGFPNATMPIGELVQGMTVEQSVPVEEDIFAIRLLFATFNGRKSKGTVTVTVTGDDSGTVYVDKALDVSELRDNSGVAFQPNTPIKSKTDARYTVSITATSLPGSAVTVWASAPDSIADSNLYVNGNEMPLDLTLGVTMNQHASYWTWEHLLPALLIAAVSLLFDAFPYSVRTKEGKSWTFRITAKWQTLRLRKKLALIGGFAAVAAVLLVLLVCVLMLPGQGAPLNVYRAAFGAAVCFVILVFLFWWEELLKNPHNLFVVIALSAGLVLALFTPIKTLVVTDDEAHYERAVQLSYLGAPVYSEADVTMATTLEPSQFEIAFNQMQIARMDAQHSRGPMSTTTLRPVTTIFGYLSYAPMAIGIAMGRWLDMSFHNMFLLGRVTNLLVYVLIVYFALRICPVGKRIMLVIALFPTNMALAANYSYDPWITALTMLWLAMLLEEIANPERELTFLRAVAMIGIFFLSVSPKEVYCILGLLLFLMPKEKLREGKQRKAFYLAVLLVMLAAVCNFVMPLLAGTAHTGDLRGGSDVNSMEQIKYVLTHPVRYALVLLKFVVEYLSPGNFEDFTTYMLYLGYPSFGALLLILLTFVTVTDQDIGRIREMYRVPSRLYSYCVLFVMVCVIATSLYLMFTPVGCDTIYGVQPRYLLPLLFPALLLTGSSRVKTGFTPEPYNLAVSIISIWILFGSIWECCISRYTY